MTRVADKLSKSSAKRRSRDLESMGLAFLVGSGGGLAKPLDGKNLGLP
jgi:hypothetical protein